MRRNRVFRLLQLTALLLAPILITAGDWPTYLHDPQRSAGSPDESVLSPANAASLAPIWTFATGGAIAASPTVSGGTVYVGSWDGYEYALNATTGALEWKTYLGITPRSSCSDPAQGISSSATVQNGVVYVGGGDSNWYALNATTGQVLWSVPTGDNSPTGGHYNWSSPLLYNGYAYIGIASFGDCPIVQGQLLQVSLTTHQIVHTFNVVPNGSYGGAIWTSPSIDPTTNTIYITTGNPADPTQPCAEPYAPAIIALDATSLAVKGWWQVPPAEQSADSDWGTTPVLFSDRGGRPLVAAANKNGLVYVFNRTNLGAGPIWQQQTAVGGDSPEAGDGSVSSAAFGQGMFFQAGGSTVINGAVYPGSVRAFNPLTGSIYWSHGASGTVLGALAYAHGLVADGAGSQLEVLNASTGTPLYTFTTGGTIFAAPTISNGQIFVGSADQNVYALSITSSNPTPTPTPTPVRVSRPTFAVAYSAGGQPATTLTSPAGGSVPVEVTLTNAGSATWPASGSNPVRLGVHFSAIGGGYGISGTPATWATNQTISLPYDVPPGGVVTLAFSLLTPGAPGNYVLEYQMVQTGVAWFPQYLDTSVSVTSLAASYSGTTALATYAVCSQPTVSVTVTNTGSSVWSAGGANPVALDVHFAPVAGGFPVNEPWINDQLFYFPSDVAPGQSVTFDVGVNTPSSAGSYVLEYQLEQLGVAFFAQDADTSVTVTGPSPPASIPWPATPTPIPTGGRSARPSPPPTAGSSPPTPTPVPGRAQRPPSP